MDDLRAALTQARALLDAVGDDQWNAPPNPSRTEGGRSNAIPNPTHNIAADERRVRLREAVVETERLLALAGGAVKRQTAILEKAYEDWQGIK